MFQTVNSLHSTVFQDKVAVVTGAAHGIGRAICLQFALHGANVIALDILKDQLLATRNVVSQVMNETKSNGSIDTYGVDLTSTNEISDCISRIHQKHGRIDILINNAGGVAGQVHQPIEEVTDEQLKSVIDINLNAAFYMIRSVAPHMKQQNYGRIVNISSGAGRSSSLTGIQAYTSAKAGQIGLTRQMARELGRFGITVNNVAPGFVLSNPATQKQWEAMGEDAQKNLIDSISVKRLGTPEDIAFPVLFFASDYAAYVSGQIISADGGLQLF